MECCQDGAGLLWLEGEKESHSSHPQRCPGSAYHPLGVCRACRTQGPFSSDRVCGMEKSCPLHFEYMLHGMWWSGSQAFRTHPITLKGKPWSWECHSQEVLLLGAPLPENMLSVGHPQAPCVQTRVGGGR